MMAAVRDAHDAIGSERPFEVEVRVRQIDDAYRWLRVRGCFAVGESNRPVRCFGVVQDVDRQREAEMQRAVAEAQLTRAQRLQAAGTLAAGISHDLNTMFAIVERISEDLTELSTDGRVNGPVSGSLPDSPPGSRPGSLPRSATPVPSLPDTAASGPAHAARRLRTVSHQGKELVGALLAYSRTTPGRRHSCDLAAVAYRALDLIRPTVPQSIECHVEVDDPGEPVKRAVMIEPSAVEQAIVNLLINARDAIDGSGRITLRVHACCVGETAFASDDDATSTMACVSVTDDGSGMAPTLVERAIDPFFTTKPRDRGTGLGLSVAHSVIEDHGGTVLIASTPGEGTSVELRLPRATSPPVPIDTKVSPANASSDPASSLVGRGIHLVTFDHQVAATLHTIFTRAGAVIASTDDPDALSRAEPREIVVLAARDESQHPDGLVAANRAASSTVAGVVLVGPADGAHAGVHPARARRIDRPVRPVAVLAAARELAANATLSPVSDSVFHRTANALETSAQ